MKNQKISKEEAIDLMRTIDNTAKRIEDLLKISTETHLFPEIKNFMWDEIVDLRERICQKLIGQDNPYYL